jgi:hypothetical protein
VTANDPVRAPAAAGVNVTEIAQLAPAATEEPQVLVSAKSPEATIWVIARAAVPAFERVTVWLVLRAPTFWLVNVSVAGLSEAWGVVVEVVSGTEQPPRIRQQARAASRQREPEDMSFYSFANPDGSHPYLSAFDLKTQCCCSSFRAELSALFQNGP